jgi:hypothetical protein
MLPPFSQEELALLERKELLGHISEPQLVQALQQTTAQPRERQSASNELGMGNHELIEALDHFAAATESSSDARTAEALSLKLKSAMGAAQRP